MLSIQPLAKCHGNKGTRVIFLHVVYVRLRSFNDLQQPMQSLRLQAVLHAPAAGAERNVGGGEDRLGLAVLSNLGQCIDQTTDETNDNGRDAAKGNRSIEENKTAKSNGKLVQSANHGVCGG